MSCILFVVLLLPRLVSANPIWLRSRDGKVAAIVYPPADSARPAPLTVMLHGMCDEPDNECPHFAESVTKRSFLICPRAETRCEGGGSIWHHQRGHQTIERSIELVREHFASQIAESEGRTLIGFSLGALFGLNVVQREDNKYKHVLLIGAKVMPSATLLRRAGVEKLVLAAGRFDMMYEHMQRANFRLSQKGFESRFDDFGPVGHRFPADLSRRMAGILEWFSPSPPDTAAPRNSDETASIGERQLRGPELCLAFNSKKGGRFCSANSPSLAARPRA
jgi:predicted esterase